MATNSDLKDKLVGLSCILFVVAFFVGMTLYCYYSRGASGIKAATNRSVIKNVSDQAKELDSQ